MSNQFYHSAEIRWFLPKQDQWDQLLKWFRHQDQLPLYSEGLDQPGTTMEPYVKLEKDRTDEYLLLPDTDTTSIKQRQGRLEIKTLVAGPHPFSFGGITGRVDQWVKWSYEPSGTIQKQLESELHGSGPWLKVNKSRYLQKYSYDLGKIELVSPDQRPDTGCNIELTIVKVNSDTKVWYTFGFESFGSPWQVMTILNEAVQCFLTGNDPLMDQLNGRDSLSYPSWLALFQ